jgi:hypothetical protein
MSTSRPLPQVRLLGIAAVVALAPGLNVALAQISGNLEQQPRPGPTTTWTLESPPAQVTLFDHSHASTSFPLPLQSGTPGLRIEGNDNTITLHDPTTPTPTFFGHFSATTAATLNLSKVTITGDDNPSFGGGGANQGHFIGEEWLTGAGPNAHDWIWLQPAGAHFASWVDP